MFNLMRRIDLFLIRLAYWVLRPKNDAVVLGDVEVKNILVIKLWGLGNLILISPLIVKIRNKFPQARISFLTLEINRGFFERSMVVDDVVYCRFTFNPYEILKEAVYLISRFGKGKVDVILNFETFNNMTALVSYLIKAPVRIGLNNRDEGNFYTHPVNNDKLKHISEVFSDLLMPLGIGEAYQYSCIKGDDSDKVRVASILKMCHSDQLIVMHPGTSVNYVGKRFSKHSFSALADKFINKHNVTVLFTGTLQDRVMIEEIIGRMVYKTKVSNLAGLLTVGGLAELLMKSRVFVSNDTGPVHLAASVGANVAAIYGPTTPSRFGPLIPNSLVFYKGLSCSPCVGVDFLNKKCGNKFKCLDFSVEDIYTGISMKFMCPVIEPYASVIGKQQ